MRINSDKLGLITVGGRDSRITSVGYFLRKYKLDELPQLLNVFIGDMSLVGPRPEVKKYVNLYTSEQRRVLSIRPGITDWASINYCDENVILGTASDPEREYIEKVMPDKLNYNFVYIKNYGSLEYFKIIFTTIWRIIFPKN
jgi:lipopolysaccharide/colanic/teichoic acid biosynthesis glycosyltransferase